MRDSANWAKMLVELNYFAKWQIKCIKSIMATKSLLMISSYNIDIVLSIVSLKLDASLN